MRTPFAVIAVLLVLLVPLALLTDDPPDGTAPTTPVATIAKRVEALRGLRYREVPRPRRVSGAQAREDGLADLDAGYPEADRRADQTLYEMLGLLPEGTDLRAINGALFGEGGVAGYYDPRSKALKVVEGAGTANRVVDEMVVAHELDHALEDQAIGLGLDASQRADDRGYAYKALVEGSATAVMIDYVGRFFARGQALEGLLGASFAGTGTGDAPPFVVAGLTFPYLGGQAFISDLRRRAGGRWTLVDLAERTRPPTTTEQILHPRKWIDAEGALPVGTPAAPAKRGWRALRTGTFGEWQTSQLVRSEDAAEGWGGDRFVLYGRGGGRWRLRMRWRFDSRRELRAFVGALRGAATSLERARVREGGGRVELDVSRA